MALDAKGAIIIPDLLLNAHRGLLVRAGWLRGCSFGSDHHGCSSATMRGSSGRGGGEEPARHHEGQQSRTTRRLDVQSVQNLAQGCRCRCHDP